DGIGRGKGHRSSGAEELRIRHAAGDEIRETVRDGVRIELHDRARLRRRARIHLPVVEKPWRLQNGPKNEAERVVDGEAERRAANGLVEVEELAGLCLGDRTPI